MLTEDCKLEDYDIEYYVEHQILRATYKIFELFGYGLEKLKAGQTTLENYGP
jgi:DNA polymerase elongation subunit (family B)